MPDVFDFLYAAVCREPVDWPQIDALLDAPDSGINDPYDEEHSLLAALLEALTLPFRSAMPELVRRFLMHGFDVHAHDGFNGGTCLHALCRSSYNRYILPAAELLLDAGADPRFSLPDDDDADGVPGSIDWKSGSWISGNMRAGNLLSAYYDMVGAALDGEDYHGIRDISDCFGKTLRRADSFPAGEPDQRVFVLWLDGLPVCINEYAEAFVSPVGSRNLYASCAGKTVFAELSGRVLTDSFFADQSTLKMCFSGGAMLTIRSRSEPSSRKTKAHISIGGTGLPPVHTTVTRVSFVQTHPRSHHIWDAFSVYLHTDEAVFHLYMDEPAPEAEDAGETPKMHCDTMPPEWVIDADRIIRKEALAFLRTYQTEDGLLRGLALRCGSGCLLILAPDEAYVRELMIRKTPAVPEQLADADALPSQKIDFSFN